MNKAILLVIALFALPLASAISLNDSILNATGLPLQINVTAPIYFTELQVNESWIYISELRTSEGATESITLNMTSAGNYLGSNLPYFSASNAYSKTILSGLYVQPSTIKTTGTACNAVQAVLLNGGIPNYTCSSGVVTITGNIKTGTNTIVINTASAYVQQSSNTIKDQLYGIIKWFGLILVIAIGTVLVYLVRGLKEGSIEMGDMFKYLGLLALGVLAAGLIFIIVIIIIAKIALSGG